MSEKGPPASRRRLLPAWSIPACAALAAVAGLLPAAPGFDAWGWLVWGRELADLGLDTGGGPSWKPLTAFAAVPVSFAGEAAGDVWLWLGRTVWLLVPVAAGLLAARLAPGRAGAAIPGGGITVAATAAAGVLLLDDTFTPWLRQGMTGLSEPLLALLATLAFAARREGRSDLSLGLVLACALLRPEAWPFVGFLLWERRRQGGSRASAPILLIGLAAAWFLPDLLGSGSPLTGAERAREGTGTPPVEALEVVWRLALLPLLALWAGAAVAVVRFGGRGTPDAGQGSIRELALAAGFWAAEVALLAAAGYAGLPRFMAPVAVAVCVLGAVGLAALVAERPMAAGGIAARVAISLVVVLCLVQAGWRVGDLVGDARGVADRARAEEPVRELAALPSVAAESRCGSRIAGFLHVPAVAWSLELPMERVETAPRLGPPPEGVLMFDSGSPPPDVVLEGGRELGASGAWRALGFGCPARQGPPGSR